LGSRAHQHERNCERRFERQRDRLALVRPHP
jgi:hypothetical protein